MITPEENELPGRHAEVVKAGVGIGGDAQKLERDHGLGCGGLADLSAAANDRLPPAEHQKWSLAGDAPVPQASQVTHTRPKPWWSAH